MCAGPVVDLRVFREITLKTPKIHKGAMGGARQENTWRS